MNLLNVAKLLGQANVLANAPIYDKCSDEKSMAIERKFVKLLKNDSPL